MVDPQSPLTPSLARVKAGNLCSGCGACAAIAPRAIRMESVPPGFLRPIQSEPVSGVDDRKIAEVCPGLGQAVTAGKRQDHPLWGPYVTAETGWATDAAMRHAGSSGGVLSAILDHLLAEGTVDAVLQVTASPDMPTANAIILNRNREGVIAAAGSRYAPSAPLAGIAPLVASGHRIAFVGKPCDAAALRALSTIDADVARTFPVILSFFCAGVPSLDGAGKVLEALGTSLEATESFRYRGNGWPGRATATLKDGRETSMSYHESWGKILSRHVQHRCKICADGTGVAADIVCADAWESDADGYPLFDEREGVSLVVARTDLGRQIIGAARARSRIETEAFDMATLAAIQPGQRERRRVLLARLSALKILGVPIPRYRGLRLVDAARQGSLRKHARNFLGMARRALRRR